MPAPTYQIIMKVIKYLICILILATFLSGCNKTSTSDEQRPVIQSIDLNASQATAGTKVLVTSSASDPQGDQLTYTWTSSYGTISDPNNSSTEWIISPTCQTNHNAKITLTVSDGKETSSLDKEIPIVMGIIVTGKVLYAGTSIPIPGVSIKLKPFSTITGNDGTFTFFHIAAGSSTIEASKTGFDSNVKTEDISDENNDFTFPMTSGIETKKIFGSVKTIDSIPLSGIRVILLNDDQTKSSLTDITDNNGCYQIGSVPKGKRSFYFSNESNPLNCQVLTKDIDVAGNDLKNNVRMKIERNIDVLQNGWESKTLDLSAPFNGTAYILTADGTIASNSNKYFRPVYCCPIPADADGPQVILTHKLTGTLKNKGTLFYMSPANTQFYMSSECAAWVDYSYSSYTFWSSAISSFLTSYYVISNTYRGLSVKFTFGLYRWQGIMPLWEVKSLNVSYYY
jgi:hypothetical protein